MKNIILTALVMATFATASWAGDSTKILTEKCAAAKEMENYAGNRINDINAVFAWLGTKIATYFTCD